MNYDNRDRDNIASQASVIDEQRQEILRLRAALHGAYEHAAKMCDDIVVDDRSLLATIDVDSFGGSSTRVALAVAIERVTDCARRIRAIGLVST